MSVQQQASRFHPLPVIGHPDAFYVKQIEAAQKAGDVHATESAKVGRYITLAADPAMPWEEKLRHFAHALKRHCNPPAGATAEVESFYHRLAELVRRHASQEAIRYAAHETESARLRGAGADPAVAQQHADEVRKRILGESAQQPAWMTSEAMERISRLLSIPRSRDSVQKQER